jgi:hypothetical protein
MGLTLRGGVGGGPALVGQVSLITTSKNKLFWFKLDPSLAIQRLVAAASLGNIRSLLIPLSFLGIH